MEFWALKTEFCSLNDVLSSCSKFLRKMQQNIDTGNILLAEPFMINPYFKSAVVFAFNILMYDAMVWFEKHRM